MWKIWDTPNFKTDEDETSWWYGLQDRFLTAVKESEKDGSLGRGGVARRLGLAPGSMLVMTEEDAAMAKALAAHAGTDYQTYLRTLLHEALLVATEKQRSTRIPIQYEQVSIG